MENEVFRALDGKLFGTEDMSLLIFTRKYGYSYHFELFGTSPAMERYIKHLKVNQSGLNRECEQLSKQLWSIYEDFDPEDHAVMRYQVEERGQPKRLRILLDDAYVIKKCLEETCKGVDRVLMYEKQKINAYKKGCKEIRRRAILDFLKAEVKKESNEKKMIRRPNMESGITLIHTSRQYNLDEYNRNFRQGDTFNGDDPDPEEIMRWPIEQEDEAKKELSKYKCSYRHTKGFCCDLVEVDEWFLDYVKYDGKGNAESGGCISAEDDPEYPYKKSKKRMFFDCLEIQGDDWGSDYDDEKEDEKEKEITM